MYLHPSLLLLVPLAAASAGTSWPPFSSLPLTRPGPRGNAWGLFGPASTDQLGMLNLLTPSNTVSAAREIRSGIRVSLDWALDLPRQGFFGRPPLQHTVSPLGPNAFADNITLNTQSSSQWDGFRHYGYADAEGPTWFGGRTREQTLQGDTLGINVWVENGGIVGRGVLLDYALWAGKNNITVSPFTAQTIPASHLSSVARDSGIKFRPGDILFIRSGFTAAWNLLSPAQETALQARAAPEYIGVEPSEDTLRWLWERRFAAVAGDAPAFEVASKEGAMGEAQFSLHAWLLAGWGMPVGEMFDLEGLSDECRRNKRWTFFVSSVPLKIPGGVAGPPNAVAIF